MKKEYLSEMLVQQSNNKQGPNKTSNLYACSFNTFPNNRGWKM